METTERTQKLALKNLLFATDFEVSSKRALPFALMIAEHYGAKLCAAHVIPPSVYSFSRYEPMENVLRETRDYASYALNQVAEPLHRKRQPCDTVIAEGDIAGELEAVAREYSIDLIVVGTSSRSGLGKIFLGSVAEELIRDSKCPVLTVGPHVSRNAENSVRSIVCALDFSPVSQLATELAFSLAHDFQSHLSLVHVLEGVVSDWPRALRVTEDRIRTMIPHDFDLPYTPRVLVENGSVAEHILRISTEENADLLVMGVRGAGAFAHVASHLGSTTHKVIASAFCPVVTVGNFGKVCS